MNKLNDLMDFSMFDGILPCVLCGGDSIKTLMGKHWKCSVCAHIFNQDGSDPGVMCICDACREKAKEEQEKEQPLDEKSLKGVLKKLKKLAKKKKV
jgi:hypothetical protein